MCEKIIPVRVKKYLFYWKYVWTSSKYFNLKNVLKTAVFNPNDLIGPPIHDYQTKILGVLNKGRGA